MSLLRHSILRQSLLRHLLFRQSLLKLLILRQWPIVFVILTKKNFRLRDKNHAPFKLNGQSCTAFGLLKAPELQRLSVTVEVLRVLVMIVGVSIISFLIMNLFQIGLLFSLPVHTYLLTCETGYWSIFIYVYMTGCVKCHVNCSTFVFAKESWFCFCV
jgi:hypothetical protein